MDFVGVINRVDCIPSLRSSYFVKHQPNSCLLLAEGGHCPADNRDPELGNGRLSE